MLDPGRAPLRFGWDPSPGLLAYRLTDDGRSLRLWRRGPGGVTVETAPFSPFLLLTDPALGRDAPGLVEISHLDGPGELAFLARFESWAAAAAARDRCRERSAEPPDSPRAPYRFLADPTHQYLLLSGRTSFGGLAFADLHRFALDIEVLTTEGYEFPSAERPGDRVIAVALADSTGFRHVIRGDRLDEPALLEECSRVIRERDPDVIEGHNIFRFDLEYIEARARRHGIALAWGRDGSPLRGRLSRLQVAERTIAYRRWEVAGRHIVDTWMLAQLHDVGARDLPSFGLKEVARHLGAVPADRTYVDPATIPHLFREAPDRLMAYALDDALETLGVAAALAPPYFAQAQLVPFDYQAVILRGAAAKIDALLLREYLRSGQAVPLPRAGAPVGGGHTAIFQQGVARPVLHADVTSLYPSLMLARGIAPASDSLGAFSRLLRHLAGVRMDAKRLAREARGAEERAHLQALQQSFKILINAFYGYLAFPSGHWNDFDAANRVTAEGRQVMTAILDRLALLGAVAVEADTDGVYFVPPPGHAREDDEGLLGAIAQDLPPGIRLELDGRYAAMFSYKMKTYALLDEEGRLTLRGSGFRSRALEPFQRRIIEEIVRLLLVGRGGEARSVIERWIADFAAHRVGVRAFARTETLGETLESYREKVRTGARPAAAPYEVASVSGRPWLPGDQVSYYVVGRGARVAPTEAARLASLWNPEVPDENVEYYQTKVREIWERFRPFTEGDGLRPYRDDPEPGAQLALL
ncbi:MAG: DNA polymerase II [Candidatus Rokubacteria bacterium]|nr:DNA polymerase II [Candidatus Rokubacteria bacterium]